MVKSGSLFALVAVFLLALTVSGSNVKLASCCTSAANKKITEPILGYLVQKANAPCVSAVIFQTQSGLFCINGRAPWVHATIAAFKKAKAQSTSVQHINKITPSVVTTSPVSLLSIITSTASPSSSPTALPSSSSTSEMSAGETFSESRNE